MDRRAIELLAQFCMAQRNNFDPHDWYVRFDIDGPAVALAAKYLSMTSWYGHEEELEQIVAGTHLFAENSAGLHQESKTVGFDLPYFSAKLRLGIAAAMLPRPMPRRERRHRLMVTPAGQGELFGGFRMLSPG